MHAQVERLGMWGNILHGTTTAPALVGVVDAVVAGALTAVVLLGSDAPLEVGLSGGAVGFAVVFGLGSRLSFRQAIRAGGRRSPRFPAQSQEVAGPR